MQNINIPNLNEAPLAELEPAKRIEPVAVSIDDQLEKLLAQVADPAETAPILDRAVDSPSELEQPVKDSALMPAEKSQLEPAAKTAWIGAAYLGAFFAGLSFLALLFAIVLPMLPIYKSQTEDFSWLKPWISYIHGHDEHEKISQSQNQADALLDTTRPLSKQHQQLVSFLFKKYRVSSIQLRKMVAYAYEAGAQTKLDPLLILAVMSVESNMNPYVESAVGAQGLMQIMPKVHVLRFKSYGGVERIFDTQVNIHVGARILQDCVRMGGGDIQAGLKCFVGATGPSDGGYGAKVLGERDRLFKAMGGEYDFSAAKSVLELMPTTELKKADSVAPVPTISP